MLEPSIAALAQALTGSDSRIWPTSAAGWVALALSALLVADRFWNRGKKEGFDEETLNGIGRRVTDVESKSTADHARIDELIRRADAVDVEMRGITTDIGRLEAKVDQSLSQGTENKVEIIGEFQRIAGEIRTGFHELDIKVERMSATMEERERVRKLA